MENETMTNDLNIPSFLKREETPEQAEKRRAKHAPKSDSKGLKVITPPDPKISAAIAKDFAEKKTKEKLDKAKTAVERINEERAKDGLRPYTQGKSDAARARKAAAKDPILQKALKERDELNAKAAAAKEKPSAKKVAPKSAPKQKTAKKVTTKSAVAPRKGTVAAKMFTEANVKKAAEMIKRKGGAKSSEIQKACGWKAVIVRRFVRDIARKRLAMRVVCDRSEGHDSIYKL